MKKAKRTLVPVATLNRLKARSARLTRFENLCSRSVGIDPDKQYSHRNGTHVVAFVVEEGVTKYAADAEFIPHKDAAEARYNETLSNIYSAAEDAADEYETDHMNDDEEESEDEDE